MDRGRDEEEDFVRTVLARAATGFGARWAAGMALWALQQ